MTDTPTPPSKPRAPRVPRKPRAPAKPRHVVALAASGGGGGDKIAKRIAAAGVASRREAEAYVRAGRVCVGGVSIQDPAHRVGAHDVLTLDGKPLAARLEPRLWRYNKPRGVLVARTDPNPSRVCLAQVLPKALQNLHPVGRLDLDSEGLLLLTNNPELKRILESPDNSIARTYELRIFGRFSDRDLDRLRRGPRLDGAATRILRVSLLSGTSGSANFRLAVTLAEGRNRELRRLAELFGWKVNRLVRIRFGPFSLSRLAQGAVEEVPRERLESFLASHARAAGKPVRKPVRKSKPAPRAKSSATAPPRGAPRTPAPSRGKPAERAAPARAPARSTTRPRGAPPERKPRGTPPPERARAPRAAPARNTRPWGAPPEHKSRGAPSPPLSARRTPTPRTPRRDAPRRDATRAPPRSPPRRPPPRSGAPRRPPPRGR